MENMLIDLLVSFAHAMGISGEGMAVIIGTTLFVLLFLAIVAAGKLFFSGLAWFGYKVPVNKRGHQFEFEDSLSLAPSDTISGANINTTSIFDR